MLNKRKTTSLQLCQFLNSTWLLNIYIIQSNPNEEISLELAKSKLKINCILLNKSGCQMNLITTKRVLLFFISETEGLI